LQIPNPAIIRKSRWVAIRCSKFLGSLLWRRHRLDGAKPENGCFDVVHGSRSREPVGTASGIESSTKVQGVSLIAKIPFIFGVYMYTDLEETPKKVQQSPGAALDRRVVNPPLVRSWEYACDAEPRKKRKASRS
jgi:hypothetical protein